MMTLIGVIVLVVLFFWVPATVIVGAIGLWIGGVIGAVVGCVIGLMVDSSY